MFKVPGGGRPAPHPPSERPIRPPSSTPRAAQRAAAHPPTVPPIPVARRQWPEQPSRQQSYIQGQPYDTLRTRTSEIVVPRVPSRSYSGRVFDHAFETAGRGTTAFANGACKDLFDSISREQALDRSTIYNKFIREKFAGKIIPNRIEFRQYLITKVFSEFANHLSPKWRRLYKEQLKYLPFKDCHELFILFSDISKAYLELENEKVEIEATLKELDASRKSKKEEKLSDKEDHLILRYLDIEEAIEKLDQRMAALEVDCFMRVSKAFHKKMEMVEKEDLPEKVEKTEKKLLVASGLSKEQMSNLTNLQHEYARKLDELNQLDRNLQPIEYSKKEEECKNCMKALIGVSRLDPKDLGKLALKFEQEYRVEADQKVIPENFVSTESKYLSGAAASVTSYLITLLVMLVAGWAILDKLENEKQKEEDSRNFFFHDITTKHHTTAIDLASMKQQLQFYPDIQDKLEGQIKEVEKLNLNLLTALMDYKKASREQLNLKNITSDLAKEKIKDYNALEVYLHKSYEPITKREADIRMLQDEIIVKHHALQEKYQGYYFEMKATTLLDGCKRDVDVIERNLELIEGNKAHLSHKKVELFIQYKKEYKDFESLDLSKADKDLIKNLESFKTGLDGLRRKVESLAVKNGVR